MTDIKVINTNDGGDLLLLGNDLAGQEGLLNQPFLAPFSGDGEWWGNEYLKEETSKIKSLTEPTLQKVALNSAGRIAIETAVKKDLELVEGEKQVTVTIQSDNRVKIDMKINGEQFSFIKDASDT